MPLRSMELALTRSRTIDVPHLIAAALRSLASASRPSEFFDTRSDYFHELNVRNRERQAPSSVLPPLHCRTDRGRLQAGLSRNVLAPVCGSRRSLLQLRPRKPDRADAALVRHTPEYVCGSWSLNSRARGRYLLLLQAEPAKEALKTGLCRPLKPSNLPALQPQA